MGFPVDVLSMVGRLFYQGARQKIYFILRLPVDGNRTIFLNVVILIKKI
jgi:hypothetical protein